MSLLEPLDIECPWCGERFEIAADPSGGTDQDLVVDCEICCRPIRLRLRWNEGPEVEIRRD